MAHHDDNERDLDAPTPPGGPLRQDEPTADVNPGPQETHTEPEPEPTVQPSSTPDGPQVVPAPPTSPSPAAEPGPDSAQAENAGTSLDQPSDGSGAE
jgi:hypothetical protein